MAVDMSDFGHVTGTTIHDDVAGPFLVSQLDVDDHSVYHFQVAIADSNGACLDNTSARALADTGANVLVISLSLATRWRAAGGILEEDTVAPIPIRLGSKQVEASQPLVCRIRVNLRLQLADYALHAPDVWVWVWPELREEFVLSFAFLKHYELLAYMQAQITPVSHAPEENLLSDMQSMNPQAEEFTDSFVPASTEVVDAFLHDPAIVNPAFPMYVELQQLLRPRLAILLAPPDSQGITGIPEIELHLREGITVNDLPRQACRFVSRALLPHLRLEIDRLLNLKIIRHPTGDSPCCSPLCLAAKGDGNLRMAVDYAKMNPFLRQSALPIPMLKFLYEYFQFCIWFGVFDFKDGYLRCRIKEEHKFLTAFISPFGIFEFNFLPFGFAGAPGWFSRFMYDFVLKRAVNPSRGLAKAAVNFIDDTGVGDRTPEGFLAKVALILDCMVAHNCRLKAKKCAIGFPQVQFCGYVFHSAGYGMSDSRKQGVYDLPPPTTYKALRSFVGLCNYFTSFVPNLATRLAPLTDRLSGNGKNPWIWDTNEQTAFDDVRTAILQCADLGHIEPGGDLILSTDASLDGCGGILIQRLRQVQGDFIVRIIAFISHKFSKQARAWATIEQEGYSIVFCVLRLEEYLLGRRFLIQTDHRNLIYILGSTIPKIVRWRLRLSEFDFSIEHIPGSVNVVADGLSRILTALRVHFDETELTLDQLFHQLHNAVVGHHGVKRTEHMFTVVMPQWRARFPQGRQRLIALCKECPVCQKIKSPPRLQGPNDVWRHLHGVRPYGSVSMDQFGPFPPDEWGNTYIQGMMCQLTRIGMGIPTQNVTGPAAAFALCHWVQVFGWPDTLRSDKGPAMTSDIIKHVLHIFGVQHVQILPHHHQANGMIERRGREVKRHINAMVFNPEVRSKWSMAAMIAYGIANGTKDRMLGETPNRLGFGDFNNPLDSTRVISRMKDLTTVNDYVKELEDVTKACHAASAKHLKAQQALEDARRIRMARPSEPLENGDYVLLEYPEVIIPRAPSRMHPTYRGPLVVIDCSRQDIIKCVDIVTKAELEVHVTDLHKFHAPDHMLPDQLLQWALADHPDEYIVEEVRAHRFDSKKKKSPWSLQLQIKWLGYGENEKGVTWEPYSKIKDNEKVDQYVLARKLPRIKERGETAIPAPVVHLLNASNLPR